MQLSGRRSCSFGQDARLRGREPRARPASDADRCPRRVLRRSASLSPTSRGSGSVTMNGIGVSRCSARNASAHPRARADVKPTPRWTRSACRSYDCTIRCSRARRTSRRRRMTSLRSTPTLMSTFGDPVPSREGRLSTPVVSLTYPPRSTTASPRRVRVYGKAGWGARACVDAGLFETDECSWVVAAMAKSFPAGGKRPMTTDLEPLADIGETIYAAWNERGARRSDARRLSPARSALAPRPDVAAPRAAFSTSSIDAVSRG